MSPGKSETKGDNPKNQLVFDALGLDANENEDTSINHKQRPRLIQDCEELLTIHTY